MEFQGLFSPVPKPRWAQFDFTVLLRDQLSLQLWIALGAVGQGVLFLLLGRLALVPAAFFLALNMADVIAIKIGMKRDPYKSNLINHKFSAQLPNSDGKYGAQAAKDSICVFIIGARNNTPLGIFDPGAKQLGDFFQQMLEEIKADPTKHGLLNASSFMSTDSASKNSFANIMYFRSAAHVHAYAHGPLHRKAWDWYTKNLQKSGKVGIYHELYQVPAGNWETVYEGMRPTLLAGANVELKDGSWASPVVDARKGPLKSSRGRMSWSDGKENDAIYARHEALAEKA